MKEHSVNFNKVIQLYDAYKSTTNGGQGLSELLGIQVDYDPNSTYEFRVDGEKYFEDDVVLSVLAERLGVDLVGEADTLIKEAFSTPSVESEKVLAYVFNRMEYNDVKLVNGELHTGINGPHGTADEVIHWYYNS